MDRLKGNAAIITGAARGIGKGLAEAFAREGADLVLVTRSNPLDEILAACRAYGVRAEGMTGDVGDSSFAKTVVAKCSELYARADILVNNAGITKDGLLVRMKEEDFDEVIRVNLKGTFNMTQAAAAVMMKQRRGRVINITSIVGQTGNAGQVNYAASKAGMAGMTMSAAKELAGRGITVNAIAPGFITTDMTGALPDKLKEKILEAIPLGRFGEVADIAHAAVYLASEEAAYVTGQTISVNGGMAMGV
ncbi:MAG: 3-oxoacyl-[acyl-carrier-protein] reductase [Nitrospinae bacterium]|nr:3-oxoacyl-[acyl-carrier-protein] reductase [Nitrospinota bacterium]